MKHHLITIIAASLLAGCATQSFVISGNTDEGPTEQTSQAFFVSGIGQSRMLDAAAICGGPAKVLKVETQETFLNGLLGVITMGIYTPRNAKVYCSK
ncbi:Bor family protein [Leptothrix discophora]|uniref:Bor family protein n=1 Tax=Leptothrix discophora TaxID=89 RepID=A0ABT9G084_LEPDI|nr:Bor family protein [Leptothrix discophora]MDP4299613.1 Bor family protein [Leptothrix discophora]